MSSSISLLPTVEFLEAIAQKQWSTDVDYGVGFSTTPARFFSTTNSEWLCLNSESEFLEAPLGTISIKNPFAYTRPESSPVFVAFNNLSIPTGKINSSESLFLFREIDGEQQILLASNYDKKPENITTAPPIDCFSRECLSWFSSDIDWFIGFGNLSNSIDKFIVDDNGIIISKSNNIINSVIEESILECGHSSIQVIGSVSTLSPFVTIQLATSVEYTGNDAVDILFLYNSDDIVAFAYQFTEPQTLNVEYGILETTIGWYNEDVVII